MSNPSMQRETSDADAARLNDLLTFQLTAVSQQFFHMLLLAPRGQRDLYAKLKEVDDIDFPNAMQIIDLLVKHRRKIEIAPHRVAPAFSTDAILRAERTREAQFATVFSDQAGADPAFVDPDISKCLLKAEAPRRPYRAWLDDALQVPTATDAENPFEPAIENLTSKLLQLMEQTLVHAFMAHHRGRQKDADTAWQMSGAAMMYLTALAPYCGNDDPTWTGYEVEGCAVDGREPLFTSDIALIKFCSDAARTAAKSSMHAKAAKLCDAIALDCDALALTDKGTDIKAGMGSGRKFRRFATAMRFVNRG